MFVAEYQNVSRLDDLDVVDAALRESVAVIYKHSPTCDLSARAARQVESFLRRDPGVPVYVVDVITQRPISQEVERRLGVRHESPQVLVVRAGAAAWDASHRAVTEEALVRALAEG